MYVSEIIYSTSFNRQKHDCVQQILQKNNRLINEILPITGARMSSALTLALLEFVSSNENLYNVNVHFQKKYRNDMKK